MELLANYYALLTCICYTVNTNDALVAFGLRENGQGIQKCAKK